MAAGSGRIYAGSGREAARVLLLKPRVFQRQSTVFPSCRFRKEYVKVSIVPCIPQSRVILRLEHKILEQERILKFTQPYPLCLIGGQKSEGKEKVINFPEVLKLGNGVQCSHFQAKSSNISFIQFSPAVSQLHILQVLFFPIAQKFLDYKGFIFMVPYLIDGLFQVFIDSSMLAITGNVCEDNRETWKNVYDVMKTAN